MPNHSISLQTAIDMTTLYRAEKSTILKEEYLATLAICETFDRASIMSIMDNTETVALRIYYGMTENLDVHAVLVGVDKDDLDILPPTTGAEILDDGERCPDLCPPASPLNSD